MELEQLYAQLRDAEGEYATAKRHCQMSDRLYSVDMGSALNRIVKIESQIGTILEGSR